MTVKFRSTDECKPVDGGSKILITSSSDGVALVEKAQEQFDETQAEQLRQKMRSESFDLEDFLDQLDRIKRRAAEEPTVLLELPGRG